MAVASVRLARLWPDDLFYKHRDHTHITTPIFIACVNFYLSLFSVNLAIKIQILN